MCLRFTSTYTCNVHIKLSFTPYPYPDSWLPIPITQNSYRKQKCTAKPSTTESQQIWYLEVPPGLALVDTNSFTIKLSMHINRTMMRLFFTNTLRYYIRYNISKMAVYNTGSSGTIYYELTREESQFENTVICRYYSNSSYIARPQNTCVLGVKAYNYRSSYQM